jgi:hypothetical protein
LKQYKFQELITNGFKGGIIMAYTPINWDEVTPINPANLNKMDNAIDSNENKLDDIDSNGDGIVDNADRLNGKRWVTIASGSKFSGGHFNINLKPGGTHTHYNMSAFSTNRQIRYLVEDYTPDTIAYAYIIRADADSGSNDVLIFKGNFLGETIYYEVLSWE